MKFQHSFNTECITVAHNVLVGVMGVLRRFNAFKPGGALSCDPPARQRSRGAIGGVLWLAPSAVGSGDWLGHMVIF